MNFISLLTPLLALGGLKAATPIKKEADPTYEKSYVADFSSLPSAFKAYDKSDASNAQFYVADNTLKIEHSTTTSVGNGNYYGAFYTIAPFEEAIGNFEMSMTFRWTSYQNNSRWLGLCYHTKMNASNMLSGYMFGLRVNGANQHSEISNTPVFSDTIKNTTGPISCQNNNYHTMKVVCKGDDMTYSLDGTTLITLKISQYSSTLTDMQYSGGFGLVVNKSSIQISDFRISGDAGDSVEHKSVDETLADTYSPNTYSALNTDVAINKWVKKQEDLTSYLGASQRPANLIMDVDENMNVIDENGTSLGLSAEQAYSQYMKGKIIPVVNIDTIAKQNAFIAYYPNNWNLIDMAVLSSNYQILKTIKSSISQIRTIYDIREKDISNPLPLLQEANRGQALTLLISSKQMKKDVVEFFQYRLKAVWIDVRGEGTAITFGAITSGAYGVISDDIVGAFACFSQINNGDFSNITTRVPANVAHRGLCLATYENSMEAFIEAAESGSTHFELDIQMSSDGHLVVMHDGTIDRTTNGTGTISNMNVQQLKNYKIIKNYQGQVMGEGVEIPLLEEVFAEFMLRNTIIVVEIKTGSAQCVPILRSLIETYDMYDKVVVISFDRNQLKNMRDYLPEIPTADLNTYSSGTFATGLVTMGSYACGIDIPESNFTLPFVKMCVARGIAPWGWTFGYGNNIMNGWSRGVMGLTNNSGNYLGSFLRSIAIKDKYLVIKDDEIFEEVEPLLDATSFDGNKIDDVYGIPVMVDDHEDYALVVYGYLYSNIEEMKYYTLFTDLVKVVKKHAYLSDKEIEKVVKIIESGKKSLTKDEVKLLKKYEQYSSILNEEDQKADVEAVKTLLANYKPAKENNKATTSIILFSSIGGGLLLLGAGLAIFLILKKKKKA